jgi:transcriptional regulator with XRE-family HTH domain
MAAARTSRKKAPRHRNGLILQLRAARLAQNILQAELEQRIGISRGSLTRYELAQRTPSGPIMLAWMQSLGFTVVSPVA